MTSRCPSTSVAASFGAPRTVTSHALASSGIASRCSYRASTVAADFAPHPGSPGNPSALSPTSASQSGMDAGDTPNFSRTAASSNRRRCRRSSWATRGSATHWARSLSGVQISTRSTRGSSAAIRAAAASASSASSSTIAHTITPRARRASSSSGNCASSSGSTPALVLYPGHMSLRNDSITWSVATPICVAPSSSSPRTEPRTPRTASTSMPSSSRWPGNAK